MAPYESDQTPGTGAVEDARPPAPKRGARRRAARYAVPVTVVGVAAATIGLVPALADSGDPDLPKISAEQLIEKIAASDTERLSGTVKISTDLGLPDLGGVLGSFAPDAGEGGGSADPQAKLMELASGTHTLRVAVDGPERAKLSVLGKGSEYSLIRNGGEVWAYDSGSNQVHHAEGGEAHARGKQAPKAEEHAPTTPGEFADEVLKAAGDTTSVTVDGSTRVAGRDAYKLVVKPKQSGSTVGSVQLAVDAKNGVPLKFTLVPAAGGSAVVDVSFTKIDFARPDASTFAFTPPKGAEVTEADELSAEHGKDGSAAGGPDLLDGLGLPGVDEAARADGGEVKTFGEGWSTIARIGTPGGAAASEKDAKGAGGPVDAQDFLDSLGDQVSGSFGSGTVFSTRLVNALMTDDGAVYVGAVTKDALVKAAESDR
ncbi:sigma-E factor regulatory protein RseB domain-containing protein [Streptomyces sp. NPDC002490]|uniref:LolA family protein n=1 Tax=Streptomyces sp. NPDC002490 TaxID=3154416 RepID=UPI00331EFFEC